MNSKIVPKFVNDVRRAATDSLKGIVAVDPGVRCSATNSRVVVRADIESAVVRGCVTLVTGGGSGHEPFAAGFVGRFGLSAAVAGDLFASPPTGAILNALQEVKSSAGTLVFVINYTGDRLNFGAAVERAKAQHGQERVELLIIDDDISLGERAPVIGGRGLAGAVLVLAVTGWLAEERRLGFSQLLQTSQDVIACVATFGVSLAPCALPGRYRMFELGVDEMELGLGIHGEPGVERSKAKSVEEIVDTVLESLTSCDRLALIKDSRFVLLLNNLGATSQLELNCVQEAVLRWLNERGFHCLERFLIGSVMTSVDAHGFSLSILRLKDPLWLEAFDAVSSVSRHWVAYKPTLPLAQVSLHRRARQVVEAMGPVIDQGTADRFAKSLQRVLDVLEENEETLNKLDGCGDGDCGTTLRAAAEAIRAEMGELDFRRPKTAFLHLAHIFDESVGGTTGAVYATLLTAVSSAIGNSVTPATIIAGLKRGSEAVQKYGGAREGDRTMLDAVLAAVAVGEARDSVDWLCVVEAAEQAAQDTAHMEAKAGRASYTAHEQQSQPDPGAVAVALWLRAAREGFFDL